METHRKRLLQTAQNASNEFHAFLGNPEIPKLNRLQVAEIYKGKMLPPRPRTAPPKKQVYNLSRVPTITGIIGNHSTVIIPYVKHRIDILKRIKYHEIEINKLKAQL